MDYIDIYLLNRMQGSRDLEGLENKTIASEADRCQFMRSNILLPERREPVFSAGHPALPAVRSAAELGFRRRRQLGRVFEGRSNRQDSEDGSEHIPEESTRW